MPDQLQIIGGEGILTTQAGNTWIIEVDTAAPALSSATPGAIQPLHPISLTYVDKHTETVLSGAWPAGDADDGLTITLQTGVCYEPEGDRIIYGYVRDFTFNAFGQLVTVSPERRVVIDTPEAC